MKKIPKVLVSAPTANAKNYCFDSWVDNVLNFTYPNFDIRLFDNSLDEGKNARELNNKVDERYGVMGLQDKFYVQNSMSIRGIKKEDSVIARMAISHNDCRGYALHNNYDYLLHLETDVFPERDVIEKLMFSKKKVIGGLFYRDEGMHRKAMVQRVVYRTGNNIQILNYDPIEELHLLDGTIHEVASVGLGCVLIDVKKVFSKIEFRCIKGQNNHPDSYFAEDCFRKKIPIYLDPSCVCRHENRQWGVYGVDFK